MLRCQCPSVCLSVCLSVTEVHWHIIANLGFKFRSHLTAHCGRRAASSPAAVLLAVLLAGGLSRTMLAMLVSCYKIVVCLGGYYHGKLVFPREFPFKPPSIYMLTPSGRFNVNTRCWFVCHTFFVFV